MTLRLADPIERAIIEDRETERGAHLRWLGRAIADAAADDAADAADDAADAADADAAAADAADADAAADDADADDAAAAADADDADADADDDDDARRILKTLTTYLREDPDMRDGLKLIQTPGRYGYAVTQVGWMRRREGDEFDFLNARTVWRSRGGPVSLLLLASEGLGKSHQLLDGPAESVQEVHRLLLGRRPPIVCDPKKWPDIKRPADWKDAP